MNQSKQMTPVQEIRHTLDKMAPQFQAALPAHIKPEKFIRVAATAIQTNPDLLNANRNSLYAACTKAAQDGLLPDGREAALVTFKDKASYMPMIAGILKKLRNSGELSSIAAQVVYEKDVANGNFRYWIDSDGEHLEFHPEMFADRGSIIGAFAMAKLTDGALYVTVMTKEQIDQVRAVSRASQNGPWKTWWDQMAEKTVLRRLSKRLPMSTDIDSLFGDDEDHDRVVAVGEPAQPVSPPAMTDITPAEPEETPKRQSRARAAVRKKKEEETAPAVEVEEIPDAEEVDDDGVVIDGDSDPAYNDEGTYADDEVPI